MDSLQGKFEHCTVVGDKEPNRTEVFAEVLLNFRRVNLVYMTRDVRTVAASWQRRADDVNDSWVAQWDCIAAARRWNGQNQTIARLLDMDDAVRARIHVLDYESFFGGDRESLLGLFGFLNLDPLPIVDAWEAMVSRYQQQIAGKPLLLSEDQVDSVLDVADMTTYLALRRAAGVSI